MKHIKLFEDYSYKFKQPDPVIFKEIVRNLDTLADFMEIDEINFKDSAKEISTYPNRYGSPEEHYFRIEQDHDDLESAYKAICDFLKETPKDIIVFWNINNLGGDGIKNLDRKEVRDGDGKLLYYQNADNRELENWFTTSIDKLFGKYMDIKGSLQPMAYGPKPMEYLGSPEKTIFLENRNKISMWTSPEGLKLVSWGWEQAINWMCTRNLIESAFSSLAK